MDIHWIIEVDLEEPLLVRVIAIEVVLLLKVCSIHNVLVDGFVRMDK